MNKVKCWEMSKGMGNLLFNLPSRQIIFPLWPNFPPAFNPLKIVICLSTQKCKKTWYFLLSKFSLILFWYAKLILRCLNIFYTQGELISDQFYHLKLIWFWVPIVQSGKKMGSFGNFSLKGGRGSPIPKSKCKILAKCKFFGENQKCS